MKKLAICGCSWASDFDSAEYSNKKVTNNSQLWQYNLGYDSKVYAWPGSTNLKIYTQVHDAIKHDFDRYLVFLTSPSRINIAWKESDGWKWDQNNKFVSGKTDVVNEYAPKETQEYIAKYYNENLEILNSFVIAEAIYWKLQQTGKPFHIFTNGFTDYIHKDWKIFKQPKIIHDGPYKIFKQQEYRGDSVPNHLNLFGQDQAKNLVLSYLGNNG